MTNVATGPDTATKESKPKLARQFVNFAVYAIDQDWRRLSAAERQTGKDEFDEEIKRFEGDKRCQVLSYSTMGMRADSDFVLWFIATDLEAIQDPATALAATALGAYLRRSHSFLSMTKRSMSLARINPEHDGDRVHLIPRKHKYLFIYPFVNKREWYLLPMAERQKMMDGHIRIGTRNPSVKLNATYSFGLDDQECVVAFETDVPADFLDLVQELRESHGSLYTLRATPILTCVHKPVAAVLDSLGE